MHALRVLEFDVVLARLAECCDTEPGASQALALAPRFNPSMVEFEVRRTDEADNFLSEGGVSLAGIKDVGPAARIAEKEGVLDGASLYAVGLSLAVMRKAREALEPRREDLKALWRLAERLADLPKLEGKLLSSLDGDGYVKDEASVELGSVRQRKSKASQRVLEKIQSYVSGRTRDLLSDAVYTQRDGRYVIPLKAENKGKIKGIVHDTSASGATVYLEPEDVVALGNEIRQLEAAEKAEVDRILKDLSRSVGMESGAVRDGVEASGELDLVLAKARLGRDMGGTVPLIVEGPRVDLRDARHPLIPRETCVPLTLSLGGETDVLLITGPNTGGKTVAIKTVGLCVAMAQCGLMPPAAEVRLGCFSQIWADIGDEQSLQQSLSTFSGHIKNIAEALTALKSGALVLLDEVGAGTDPAEGAALARSLLLTFQEGGAKVMASTHYGELKVMASNTPGFMNASMEFDLKSLRPTYHLLVGVPGSSHAFRIAERYGVPARVLGRAAEEFGEQELDVAQMIEKLQTAQRQAQKTQGEADRLAARLREVEREAERKISQAEETRRSVRERAATELEELLRLIRIEAADLFEALKKDPSQSGFDKARAQLKELQEVGLDFVKEAKPKARAPQAAAAQAPLKKGTAVQIAGFTQTGVVLDDPKGGQVLVQAGPLKMTCKVSDLTPIELPVSAPARSKSSGLSVHRAMHAQTEIHLRQMRAEDAELELQKFLDEAVLGGLSSVRIVHGKGEGVLRKVTHEALRRHRHVRSFREGEPEEGGAGVTIATLK